MKTTTILTALAAMFALSAVADAGVLPASFTYTQTDLTTGAGTLSASINVGRYGGPNGFLTFTGTMPVANVSSTYMGSPPLPPIPGYAIGALNVATSNGQFGVHLGWSGNTTMTATGGLGDNWTIEVPLKQAVDGDYVFSSFATDDPNAGIDMVSDLLDDPRGTRFAFWLGEYKSGFRENNGRFIFLAGNPPDTHTIADTSGSESAAGADLGLMFGIRQQLFTGAVLVDTMDYSGPLGADDTTMKKNGAPAPKLPILPADPFNVVLDIGPQNQRVQSSGPPDHIGLPDPNDAFTPIDNQELAVIGIPLDTGTGTLFSASVTFSDQNGEAEGKTLWRDRGDSSAGAQDLVQLGEDFVSNDNGIIRLTFDDLPPGDYDVVSYHIDPDINGSLGPEPADQVRAFVDNGDGAGFVERGSIVGRTLDLGGVDNLTTTEVEDTSISFSFFADGLNPVIILFDARAADPNAAPGGCGTDPDEVFCDAPLNGLSLSYTPGFPGDVNGDELVDDVDRDIIRMNFFKTEVGGLPVELSDGDLNRDNIVDFLDYRFWKFFVPVPLAASSASVPEPASLAMILLGGAALLGIRRRI